MSFFVSLILSFIWFTITLNIIIIWNEFLDSEMNSVGFASFLLSNISCYWLPSIIKLNSWWISKPHTIWYFIHDRLLHNYARLCSVLFIITEGNLLFMAWWRHRTSLFFFIFVFIFFFFFFFFFFLSSTCRMLTLIHSIGCFWFH